MSQGVMAGMADRTGTAWSKLNTVGIGDSKPRSTSRPPLRPRTLQVKPSLSLSYIIVACHGDECQTAGYVG
jgi:hypothetical protein